MQVGSPVELELAGSYRFRSAQDAYAVAADVKRQLAERHERGGWYRVRPEQVRRVLGNRCARQAPPAAAEARQVAASAQAEAERVRAQRARQRGRSRAQARRQKVRALASLLASGLTHREAAEVIGVDERTIRRWAQLPGFGDELAKAHIREQSRRERASEGQHKRRQAEERRRLARLGPQQNAGSGDADTRPEPERPAAESAAAAPPDRRVRIVDESGETIARTSASNAERVMAALGPRHGPLTVIPV
jgi:hypothetical protein